MFKQLKYIAGYVAISLALLSSTASAGEGGSGVYTPGASSFFEGMLPPPGNYVAQYFLFYSANRLNDNNGNKVPIDFKVQAIASATRYVKSTDKTFFGARYGWSALVPLVDLDLTVNGTTQTTSGLGDVVVTPIILNWNWEKFNLILGNDLFIPVGPYDKNASLNIGTNTWGVSQIVATTWFPTKGFEVNSKNNFIYRFKNGATNYKSGAEFIGEYAAGQNFGNWQFGIQGYLRYQFSNDTSEDAAAQAAIDASGGNRAGVFAIGPAFRYNLKGVQLYAAYEREVWAQNLPQGNRFWFRGVFTF